MWELELQNTFASRMKNAFEKYFLSLVFILLSGFAILQANSVLDNVANFDDISVTNIDDLAVSQDLLRKASPTNLDLEKAIIEITECEELEVFNKDAKTLFRLNTGSIFAFVFFVFTFEFYLRNKLVSYHGENDASRTVLSKRYIQFETFRI